MDQEASEARRIRLKRHQNTIKHNEEPKITNKAELVDFIQDLRYEGNCLFKNGAFKDARMHYHCAIRSARILEVTFYKMADVHVLSSLFANASLCSIKSKNFEEAVKEAELAIQCQPDNLRALYRKAVALKELKQFKEALKYAERGEKLDTANFTPLVTDIRSSIESTSEGKSGKKSSAESSSQRETGSSKGRSGSDEWLIGTNAFKEPNPQPSLTEPVKSAKKMPKLKKNKGQKQSSGSQTQQQSSSAETQSQNQQKSEEFDSDSDNNDENFAQQMKFVQGGSALNLNTATESWSTIKHGQKVPKKKASRASSNGNLSNSEPGTPKKTKGLSQSMQNIAFTTFGVVWPLETHVFRLACKICFVKEKEGINGQKYREDLQHFCSHDVLIVKKNGQAAAKAEWLKIRSHIPLPSGQHIDKFRLCSHYLGGMPCQMTEAKCSFTHNNIESKLWMMERNGAFNIAKFMRDAKMNGTFTSELLNAATGEGRNSPKPNIPGMNYQTHASQSNTARKSPPRPPIPGMNYAASAAQSKNFVPTHMSAQNQPFKESTSRSPGKVSDLSSFNFKLAASTADRKVSEFQSFTVYSKRKVPEETFQRPPSLHAYQAHDHQPSQSHVKGFATQMPNNTSKQSNTSYQQQQAFQRPPPQISQRSPPFNQPSHQNGNPLPHLEYKLYCDVCLVSAQQDAWQFFVTPQPHQCKYNVLAYRMRNQKNMFVWVKVRERLSHRYFVGSYVLCHSYTQNNEMFCKMKDHCSFAHNPIECELWTLEKENQFDITDFIINHRRARCQHTLAAFSVEELVMKHGGYFQFICRDCYYSPFSPISQKGEGDVCMGRGRHQWSQSKVLAHVHNNEVTPVDIAKFRNAGAFYQLCRYLRYCRLLNYNTCNFAHSKVELSVWRLERDTALTREEVVTKSIELHFHQHSQPPPSMPAMPDSTSQRAGTPKEQFVPENNVPLGATGGPPVKIAAFCSTCWQNGTKSQKDGVSDKCVRNHHNFQTKCVYLSQSGKQIRTLPGQLANYHKLVMCLQANKCNKRLCTFPHNQDELDTWNYMLKNSVSSLDDVCKKLTDIEKANVRKIQSGESVVRVVSAWQPQGKSVSEIIAPGDLVTYDHYCHYCSISCKSRQQWDNHCTSEKHVNNVNSDMEHQWNFRQPPWGLGNNLSLCARHLEKQSCRYSHVPDKYNLCKYAHSQEELDEWKERYEFRQMKRAVAKQRHMFSYTESLLQDYYESRSNIDVIVDTLPGVSVKCNAEETAYKDEKNETIMWTYYVTSCDNLEKVSLLHNQDRLHFSLIDTDNHKQQVAEGKVFLELDDVGRRRYRIQVHFMTGIFGSFSQWLALDFGTRPVLVRKLAVDVGSKQIQTKVKTLRKDLDYDVWTSQNSHVKRNKEVDKHTEKLMTRFKQPTDVVDVVNRDNMVELNIHNYIPKMHKLLELEEMTRHRILSKYNLVTNVTVMSFIEEAGMFMVHQDGGFFIKVNLSENLTLDTQAGKLVLESVRTVWMAPASGNTKVVYELEIVGENNFGYDGRGKDYIYVAVPADVGTALNLTSRQTTKLEFQFQMDRAFFCRMHHALDSLSSIDIVFPDVLKFKSLEGIPMKVKSELLNDDQIEAVTHVLVERKCDTPPFVMYGPFGTGKTETLAQATMSLLTNKPNARILICTRSNSAADLYITKHLKNFLKNRSGKKYKLLRCYHELRKRATVLPDVLEYCYSENNVTFKIPTKEVILEYQVVVTTVETSIFLHFNGLQGDFTHIFLDEAGQVLESEILMPLSLATTKTCIVLAGDHHQISPPVYSNEACRQRFDEPLLVRLYNYYNQMAKATPMAIANTALKSPLNIFLSINYRTKMEILRFISSIFYGGPDNLKAYGNIPAVIGITPLAFYIVQGKEEQGEDSTSYLNQAEAREVVEQVQSLLDNWPQEWGPKKGEQVAIITSYKNQVKYIRDLLRRQKSKPELKKIFVDVLDSVQGKEFRALFISTVRTVNLLKEKHIINTLKSGESIGDLGFLSNPKLINTALTRTQSFVGVVGDPVALCMIGECISVWRTYVKHCGNMKSLYPSDFTYDRIKKMVVQRETGPEEEVVRRIKEIPQEDRQVFPRLATPPKPQNVEVGLDESPEQMEDLVQEEEEDEEETVPPFVLNDSDGSQLDTSPSLPARQKPKRQFIHDELNLCFDVSFEDIVYQLAKENQRSVDSDVDVIRSGGIFLQEEDGFAVLGFDPLRNDPLKLVTSNEDFVIYRKQDLSNVVEYENWGLEKLIAKAGSPGFVLGMMHFSKGVGKATILHSPMSQAHLNFAGQDVKLQNQFDRGHALDGDLVVVQLMMPAFSSGKLQGQVKGIFRRAHDPTNNLFVCTADANQPGILTPLNQNMPRIFSLTTQKNLASASRGHVPVYRFTSSKCIVFSHDKKIHDDSLFVVRYLAWLPKFSLPIGIVVDKLDTGSSLSAGMRILETEHTLDTTFLSKAQDEVETLVSTSNDLPFELTGTRTDLTEDFSFSITDAGPEDVEMAFTLTQDGENYKVGLHVSDVAAFIAKDSLLDQECELRGASLSWGKKCKHMLPGEISTQALSLLPGRDRLTISVIETINSEGESVGQPDLFCSLINVNYNFTHTEIQELLFSPEEAEQDYSKSCVFVLYQLSQMWRLKRLGNAQFGADVKPNEKSTQHSRLMLQELIHRFNSIVALNLEVRFPACTPLLIQPPPDSSKLIPWRKENAPYAINSITMTTAFLDGQICSCEATCTCIFRFIREHQLQPSSQVSVLKDEWRRLEEADLELENIQEIISNTDILPEVSLAASKLSDLQPPAHFACSETLEKADRRHNNLCLESYTLFSSPLRRYCSIVIQRLLTACIKGSASPYSSRDIQDICLEMSNVEDRARCFYTDVLLLHLGAALQTRPLSSNSVLQKMDKTSIVLDLNMTKDLPVNLRTIQLSDLSPCHMEFDENSQKMKLFWEERVYDYKESKEVMPTSVAEEIELDPDRFVYRIPFILWQQLLGAIRKSRNSMMDGLDCTQEPSQCIMKISQMLDHSQQNYPDVRRGLGKDGQKQLLVPFCLNFQPGQCLGVQMSAQVNKGVLAPSVQLLNLSPTLDICLKHQTQPDSSFLAKNHDAIKSTIALTSIATYQTSCLLSLQRDSVFRAVRNGKRITIHNLDIRWTETDSCKSGSVQGNFFLTKEFCREICFNPKGASSLVEGKPLLTDDAIFCEDLLCVRYANIAAPEECVLEDNVSVLVNNGQPITWVGHCVITKIATLAKGTSVQVRLMQANMRIPIEEITSGGPSCTVEWIMKTPEDRVTDIAMRSLKHASDFTKDIVLGRRPSSTVDPIPMTSLDSNTFLLESQKAVMADSYRSPFSVISGGPGTGKTMILVHLIFLYMMRNKKVAEFRQMNSCQVMVCAPNEESLDVISDYILAVNHDNINVVRVYSEEVEEQEFPIFTNLVPTRNTPARKVKQDVALHHLIRKGKHNKNLLDMEMLMSIYGRQQEQVEQFRAALEEAQISELKKADVILCTCTSSARTVLRKAADVKQLIVDDCNCISEPETLVPLVAHKDISQAVLLGDLQMPEPAAASEMCKPMESLMKRYLDNANFLVDQFRCVESLCEFPNRQFYQGVIVTASSNLPQPSNIQFLSKSKIPSYFCHMDGVDTLEDGIGPVHDRLTNQDEVTFVISVVRTLVQQHKVEESSIMVVTFSKAQAALLKSKLSATVRVLSVLESIGQESKYVILSTVRAMQEFGVSVPPSSVWIREHLGNLSDPHVVNLALTRCKAGLFIVGNKDLLSVCSHWSSLLKFYNSKDALWTSFQEFLKMLM